MKASSIILIIVGIIFMVLPFVFKQFVGQSLFTITLLIYLLMMFGLIPAIVIFIIFPDTPVSVEGFFSFMNGLKLSAGGAFAAFFISMLFFWTFVNSWYFGLIDNLIERDFGNSYVQTHLSMKVKLRNE